MSEQRVKRVVIAGGGTAGWIVAAALSTQLGPLLDITLVESDEIGTVGVGESTIPTTRGFHGLLRIDEQAFMKATGSSFKLGIAFEDWARIGDRYIHSFGTLGKATWMADFQHVWLHGRAQGVAGPIGEYCLEHEAADAGRFATKPGAAINYAYHLDATLYGRFLRGIGEAAGTKRIEGRIERVERDGETGDISALVLASGTRIEGDLFIDCTGFRGLLIEQTLGAGFEDWNHWLPTDSALAVQTASTGPAFPYTRAVAHEAGWRWRIPLQHRVGNGLVFSSAHMTEDAARVMLRDRIEGDVLIEPRLIRFRAGRRCEMWRANCIAFGLAGGFVEPLESTSIHLIMDGVTRLIQAFPFGGIGEAARRRYNEQSRRELEGIRDFIVLHYHATERDDSDFWRMCRTMDVPDTLNERIALFVEAAQAYQAPGELFRIDSWVQVMLGQRLQPRSYHAFARLMRPDQLRRALSDLKANIAKAVASMPAHQDFLDHHAPATPA